jgi:hypothetical protein
MKNLFRILRKLLTAADSGRISAIWQGILHVAVIYFIARLCIPWLVDIAYSRVPSFLLGHPLRDNPVQFFFSHLLALSILPGFVAGFVNVKLFRNRVVYIVWLVPVAVLVFMLVFEGPGIYPTMLWESDFRQAFHCFFGGDFRIVGEYHNYRDLPRLVVQNSADFIRGYTQFRVTAPAYVSAAYCVGAWLSLGFKKTAALSGKTHEAVAQTTSGG